VKQSTPVLFFRSFLTGGTLSLKRKEPG